MTDPDQYFTWEIRINILHDKFGSIFYMRDSDLYFTWQIRIHILHARFGSIFYMTDLRFGSKWNESQTRILILKFQWRIFFKKQISNPSLSSNHLSRAYKNQCTSSLSKIEGPDSCSNKWCLQEFQLLLTLSLPQLLFYLC